MLTRQYTPYEGLNSASQKNRKLRVLAQKLKEVTLHFIVTWVSIRQNTTMMFMRPKQRDSLYEAKIKKVAFRYHQFDKNREGG